MALIKPPKTQRLPDIVTIEEAKRLFISNSHFDDNWLK